MGALRFLREIGSCPKKNMVRRIMCMFFTQFLKILALGVRLRERTMGDYFDAIKRGCLRTGKGFRGFHH